MQLTTLSDSRLLSQIKTYVSKERKLTTIIVEHLEEIERRKLYCDFGYNSLFQYCMKELAYSEDQACRRINAMRTSKTLPEVKKKLDNGTITLTTLNILSSASNELCLSKTEKSQLLDDFSGKSKRECLKKVDEWREFKGQTISKKSPVIRADQEGTSRLTISLDHNTVDQLKSLANEKNMSIEDVVTYLVKKEKAPTPAPEQKRKRKGVEVGKGRYIPKKVKEIVRAMAGNKCQNCGSTHHLQFEHVRPIAHGGLSESTNLKLLCRNCNLRAGIKVFGTTKMQRNIQV